MSHHRPRTYPVLSANHFVGNDKLLLVLVGLPARGKSTLANKIHSYLAHAGFNAEIFNVGQYRRRLTSNLTVGQASAKFFDPDNEQANVIRTKCCLYALDDMMEWFQHGGQIGFLDATNTTIERRNLIRDYIARHQHLCESRIHTMFVECICDDDNAIHNNIVRGKLHNADYKRVNAKKALEDFQNRIKMYKKVYVEVQDHEGCYVKVVNFGQTIRHHDIKHSMACHILYFLMHLHSHILTSVPKTPWMMRQQNYNPASSSSSSWSSMHSIGSCDIYQELYVLWYGIHDNVRRTVANVTE